MSIVLILHLESRIETQRERSSTLHKRWQGDKLVLSTEIDYFVFLSSSYSSNTDALKHSNDTLEKNQSGWSGGTFFPFPPTDSRINHHLCALPAQRKENTPSTPKTPTWKLFSQPKDIKR